MNRELKFRVWGWKSKLKFRIFNLLKKYWVKSWVNYCSQSLVFLPEKSDTGEHTVEFFDTFNGSEFILQQYTGLKDKNGKDIYEGDIVKFDDSEIASHPTIGLAEVIYTTDMTLVNAPSFGLWFVGEKAGFYPYMLGDIEVIGNVYENPELLKA